jgi:uncharacterized protein YkwD
MDTRIPLALLLIVSLVDCARPPPEATPEFKRRLAQPPSGKERALEQDLIRRTNRERRRRGLPALRPQGRYHRVARAHSRDMRDSGFMSHVSPTTGGPDDRLLAAGLAFMAAKENIARGYTPQDVIEGLMQSPGHRANILSRDVTHIGLGVAIDRKASPRALFVTQVFVTPGKAYNPRSARRDVLAILARCRRKAGRRPLATHAGLNRIAERAVRERPDDPGPALTKAMEPIAPKFRSVQSSVVRTSVLDAMGQTAICKLGGVTHIGLAVTKRGQMIIVGMVLGSR